MYKLSESVEFLEIEPTWTELSPFGGGGSNRAFGGEKSIGRIHDSRRNGEPQHQQEQGPILEHVSLKIFC